MRVGAAWRGVTATVSAVTRDELDTLLPGLPTSVTVSVKRRAPDGRYGAGTVPWKAPVGSVCTPIAPGTARPSIVTSTSELGVNPLTSSSTDSRWVGAAET